MRSVGKVFSPLELIQISSGQIVLHIVPSYVILFAETLTEQKEVVKK